MKLLSVKLKKESQTIIEPINWSIFIQSGPAKSPLPSTPSPGSLFYLCVEGVYAFFSCVLHVPLTNIRLTDINTIWVEVYDIPGKTRVPITAELLPSRRSEISKVCRSVDFSCPLYEGLSFALDVDWIDFVYDDYKENPESFSYVEDAGDHQQKYQKTYHVQFYYKG